MSEVKTMSSIYFPNTQQPYQLNDARIPADHAPYMQLVTDGEGKVGWEQRLAYIEAKKEIIYSNPAIQTVAMGNAARANAAIQFDFVDGEAFTCVFDGTDYTCTAKYRSDFEAYYLGNVVLYILSGGGTKDDAAGLGLVDTGEPFFIVLGENGYFVTETAGTFNVAIYSRLIKPIDDELLPKIPKRKTYAVVEETVAEVKKWTCGLDFATAWNMSPEALRESLTFRATENNPIECQKMNTRQLGDHLVLHFRILTVSSSTGLLTIEDVYLKWNAGGITEVTVELPT